MDLDDKNPPQTIPTRTRIAGTYITSPPEVRSANLVDLTTTTAPQGHSLLRSAKAQSGWLQELKLGYQLTFQAQYLTKVYPEGIPQDRAWTAPLNWGAEMAALLDKLQLEGLPARGERLMLGDQDAGVRTIWIKFDEHRGGTIDYNHNLPYEERFRAVIGDFRDRDAMLVSTRTLGYKAVVAMMLAFAAGLAANKP